MILICMRDNIHVQKKHAFIRADLSDIDASDYCAIVCHIKEEDILGYCNIGRHQEE